MILEGYGNQYWKHFQLSKYCDGDNIVNYCHYYCVGYTFHHVFHHHVVESITAETWHLSSPPLQSPGSLEDTPLSYVDTPEQLQELKEKLCSVSDFAVDLEVGLCGRERQLISEFGLVHQFLSLLIPLHTTH